MATTVGRPARSHERAEEAFRLGARLLAVAGYAVAVVVAVALLAPVLQREEGGATAAGMEPAAVYTVRSGDTLAVVAAEHGVSVGRLLALNPRLGPLGLERGAEIRLP